MIHCPYGSSNSKSPCMHNEICSKHFPKRFNEETYVDRDGYLCYKRVDSGLTIEKNGIELDNRYVVAQFVITFEIQCTY